MKSKNLAFALVCAIGFSTWVCPSVPPPTVPCPIECVISADESCLLGQAPQIYVRIFNRSRHSVLLVGSLDGSSEHMRFPYCRFEISGPEGWEPDREYGRCGYTNPLDDKDFAVVPPDGWLDPYHETKEYFRSRQLRPADFAQRGEYLVRFCYSTDATNAS